MDQGHVIRHKVLIEGEWGTDDRCGESAARAREARHARPYHPQAKDKTDRFIRTCCAQLLPTLVDGDTGSLDTLSRRLWAWLEDEYHETPHRGLEGETPLTRWAATAGDVALPPEHLDELFLFEEKHKLQKDRTVSLRGVVYEVDASVVGETVTLRYDPARATRGITVVCRDRVVDVARPVGAYANGFVRPDHGTKNLTATVAILARKWV